MCRLWKIIAVYARSVEKYNAEDGESGDINKARGDKYTIKACSLQSPSDKVCVDSSKAESPGNSYPVRQLSHVSSPTRRG
jgi:hypothetical protein